MTVLIDDKKVNVIVAKSFFKRFIGLMFKRKKVDYGLYFPKCASVHTFFMFQNIDIIMTDQNDIITEIYKDVTPNRVILGVGYGTYEFASGTVNNLKIGDLLKKEA